MSAADAPLLRGCRPNCSDLFRTTPGTDLFRTVPPGNSSGTLRNSSSAFCGIASTCRGGRFRQPGAILVLIVFALRHHQNKLLMRRGIRPTLLVPARVLTDGSSRKNIYALQRTMFLRLARRSGVDGQLMWSCFDAGTRPPLGALLVLYSGSDPRTAKRCVHACTSYTPH